MTLVLKKGNDGHDKRLLRHASDQPSGNNAEKTPSIEGQLVPAPSAEILSSDTFEAVRDRARVNITSLSDEAILNAMPDERNVNISYLLKALKIRNITDARSIDLTLKRLVASGRLQKVSQEGKSYYKKV